MLFQSRDLRLSATDHTATLWLDRAGRSDNLLTLRMLRGLIRALRVVRDTPGLEVLVLRSAKPDGFIVGHDPHELATLRSESDWLTLAGLTQYAGERLARLARRLRTVAFIDGPCLGPGLELALACEHRLALCRPTTVFGFDQVAALGLPPWGGGAARLVPRIGLAAALRMLLHGWLMTGRQAHAIGLVDHAFCERIATVELRAFVDRLCRRRPRRSGTGFHPFAGRRIDTALTRELTRRPAEDAPLLRAIARSVRGGLHGGIAAAMAEERRGLLQAASAGTPPRLRLACAVARVTGGPRSDSPRSLGLIGASAPAARLAALALLRGRRVIWTKGDAAAREQIRVLLEEVRRQGGLTPLELDTLLKKGLRQPADGSELEDADIIFDATAEPVTAALGRSGPGRARLHFAGPIRSGAVLELALRNRVPGAVKDRIGRCLRALGLLPVCVADSPVPLARHVRRWLGDEVSRLLHEGVPAAELGVALLQVRPTTDQLLPETPAQLLLPPTGAPRPSRDDILKRLRLTLLNEAAAALGEGRADSAEQIDLILAGGAGLLPQAGGPLAYADALGLRAVVADLERLARQWGPRFAPCAELVRRAVAGEPFYGRTSKPSATPAAA